MGQARLDQTLIVMPAFNEAASVGAVVREVNGALGGVTCLVVDDGSTDQTAAEARDAGAVVVRLPFNLGVGGAMRVGFTYALQHGFDYVVQVDADGQHDPQDIVALLAALDSADVAIGSRFAGAGDYRMRGPRRWAISLLSRALSRVAGVTITDATSGFRASGPRAVWLFSQHYPAEYLGDTVESLTIAARARCVVREVPVAMRARNGGRPSQNPVTSALYLGRACIALVFALVRPRVAINEAGIVAR